MKLLGVEIGAPPTERGQLARLLERNAQLRDVFAHDAVLAQRLAQLQRWQAQRLMRSHADLHGHPRYRLATEFFFRELYAAGNVRQRDSDLIRVQSAMERLLPREGLVALCLAIELETLSQELDADTVRGLPAGPVTVARYADAYRAAGRAADRIRQVELMGQVGAYLDGVVHKPIVRGLVKLARRPAHAAGFGLLQEFLERGLVAFEAMHGAREFLQTLRTRELRASRRLFDGAPDPFEFGPDDISSAGPAHTERSTNRAKPG
ncbi:MAG: FFLEELY motif protein [Steroidobacteraceae bacterium]